MQSKHALFRAGFLAIASLGAHRWLRPLAQGRGVILMFHHVRPQAGYRFDSNRLLEITPEFLEAVLTELRRERFDIVPLDEVPYRLRAEGPRRFAALTFDDGYRDNIDYAWPILRRHAAPWTLYVTTDFARGSGRLWWLELEQSILQLDRVPLRVGDEKLSLPARSLREKRLAFETVFRRLRAGPEDGLRAATADLARRAGICTDTLVAPLCLNWREVQAMAREDDVTIGAHTVSHPMLAKHDIATAEREIVESKRILESHIGVPVRHFAYPGGDATCAGPREFAMVREAGFDTAVTTRPGHLFAYHLDYLHALPRVSVNGLFQSRSAFRALLSGVPFLPWYWRGNPSLQ